MSFSQYSRSLNIAWREFAGMHAGSSKEPDYSITHESLQFPNIIVESGWLESFPRLREDKDLWIHGGAGKVLLVLLLDT